jgi:tetratricopeptide (TPR) repeat protein
MTRRTLAAILTLGLCGAALVPGRRINHGTPAPVVDQAVIRDRDIGFYAARVARDPMGARDLGVLAALYLARGRDRGDASDLERAVTLAKESFDHRPNRNEAAAVVLATALMAQHRFVEAYDVVRQLVAADSTEPVLRATLGEIALELGRYAEAARLMHTIESIRYESALAPRYARWLEIEGRSGEARDLLAAARERLVHGWRIPTSQLAWFDLRLGDLALRNGRLDQAEEAYRRGLGLVPDDRRLEAGMARLAAARHRWRDATRRGEAALAGSLDPQVLALLADSYLALGDTARASEYGNALAVAASGQPDLMHRGWVLFLLDHGHRADSLADRAVHQLDARPDVYGHDLAAWALYRAGRSEQAWPHALAALSRGTRDGLLHYHAGRIGLARGDTAWARTALETALSISPTFDPFHADSARALLEALQ